MATKNLKQYKKKGPSKSTKQLLESISELSSHDLYGKSLLDIGAGIGVIGIELTGKGLERTTWVDIAE